MRGRFLSPGSHLWSDFLSQTTHDFYHLPQYSQLSAKDRLSAPDANGEPLAFLAEDEEGNSFFVPLIVRPIAQTGAVSGPLFDAISPYGYASPLIVRRSEEPLATQFVEGAIASLAEGLKDRGVVSAFVRLHPTLDLPLEPLRNSGSLVQHGHTVYIDLTLPPEELWHQTRAGHRSEINRARRNGFTVTIDQEWNDFEGFFRAYTQTMHRVGATDQYFFPREYFAELRHAIGHALHLCIVRKGEDIACGGIFTESCGIVQYHLSGTTDEFHSQYPTKVMLDSVRTWAKQRGNHTMHLGGGFGGAEDSLFAFKAGFSHLRSPFYTWRLIADGQMYATLSRQWESRTGKMASAPGGFFPAYRAA
jgi:hypothetical protein